jgi:hypothetical protein
MNPGVWLYGCKSPELVLVLAGSFYGQFVVVFPGLHAACNNEDLLESRFGQYLAGRCGARSVLAGDKDSIFFMRFQFGEVLRNF